MPRLKKLVSPILKRAKVRQSHLEAWDPDLDLGGGMSVKAFTLAVSETDDLIATYNRAIAESDEMLLALRAKEAALAELTTNVLAAVGIKFGKKSQEYIKAGGKARGRYRSSESAPTMPATA